MEDTDDLLVQAYALRSIGMLDEAMEKCNAAIASADAREDTVLLGRDLAQQRGESSIDFLRPFVEHHPDKPALATALAAMLDNEGKTEEAIAMFRRVLAINPAAMDAVMRLGEILIGRGETEAVVEVFDRAAERAETPRPFYNRVAIRCAELGLPDLAERFLLKAEADGPLDAEQRHIIAAIRGVNTPNRADPEYISEMFDRHAGSFDETLASLGYAGPAMVAKALERLGLEDGLDILDAGCGTGLCGPVLAPHARHLTGIDLSDAMLALAEDRGCYDTVKKLDLMDAGDRFPRSFDLIVSSDVLVYSGVLESVLNAFTKALRPAGYLIITVEEAPNDTPPGYMLQANGRYRHAAEYARNALRSAGICEPMIEIRDTLRLEYQRPVAGLLLAGTPRK